MDWANHSQRASFQGALEFIQYDPFRGRQIPRATSSIRQLLWESDTPEPLALVLDVGFPGLTSGPTSIPKGPLALLAGTTFVDDEQNVRPLEPVTSPFFGQARIRYGWANYESELVMDLRTGTFALPACNSVSVQLATFFATTSATEDVPPPAIRAAVVPGGGVRSELPTFTYVTQLNSSDDGPENESGPALPVPSRARSYRAWMYGNSGQEALVTRSQSPLGFAQSEPRRWEPTGTRPARVLGNPDETVVATVEDVEPSTSYLIHLQFELSP